MAEPIDESISEEKRKDIFSYFLKDFMSLMRGTSSTLGSVSQAIRSYGYFAGVCFICHLLRLLYIFVDLQLITVRSVIQLMK